MKIYADNAATTKMSRTAIDTMVKYMEETYGNPSSLYMIGQEAKEALEEARETVAKVINAEPREIIFTSGGSEADNQAIVSAAAIGAKKGKKHIISSAFEHHAVLHTLAKMEKEGFEVTLLDVHEDGSLVSTFGLTLFFTGTHNARLSLISPGGAADEALRHLEALGLADGRWQHAVRGSFALPVPLAPKSGAPRVAGAICRPDCVKLKWTHGRLAPARFYQVLRVAPLEMAASTS